MGRLSSQSDIRYLKQAARLAAEICDTLMAACKPGVTTPELEELAVRLLAQNRSTAPFRDFDGFNHATCISINEEIVNGLPSRVRTIRAGDLVSIALGTEQRGLYGKVARTVYVGDEPPPPDIQRLLDGTRAVFASAVERSRSVDTLNELLQVVPETAREYGLTVIDNMGGAGIGKKLHEPPATANQPESLPEVIPLTSGLAFTLMPMLSLGDSPETRIHEDGWTFLTADGALSCHMAQTCLMTPDGLQLVSLPEPE